MLVVWAYNLDDIIPHCRDFEDKLIKLVWNRRSAFTSLANSTTASAFGSDVNLNEKPAAAVVVAAAKESVATKEAAALAAREKKPKGVSGG